MKDFILGLKLAKCYIQYGYYIGIKRRLIDGKCSNVRNLAKLNKVNKKISELEIIIEEIESLG